MVAGMHLGLDKLVAEFFDKPEIKNGIMNNQDTILLMKASAFQNLSKNPLLSGNYERLVAIRNKFFIAPR
jgi:hypothetical protein